MKRLLLLVMLVGLSALGSHAQVTSKQQVLLVTSDFATDGALTTLQTIRGLQFFLPANQAIKVPFWCELAYSQATGAVSDAFGIQAATTAPTNIQAQGQMQTNTTAFTWGNAAITGTSATAIVTATPGATATVFVVRLTGMIENASNAADNQFNIMVSTATAADIITVKKDSFCVVGRPGDPSA